MRTALLSLLLLVALTGCNTQSRTRAAFEADHPYAKKTMEIPATTSDQLTVVEYRDAIPATTYDGRFYTLTPIVYTLAYNSQGDVVARSAADPKPLHSILP